MRYRAVAALLILCTALVSGGWLLQRGLQSDDSAINRARLFDQVFTHIRQQYVDSLEEGELFRRAVDGLLSELKDPYTTFLTAERLARLTETTTGNYGGIGIQIDIRDRWVVVVTPLPGSPAERAGIQIGDRIVEIEGQSTQGWTVDEARTALRGPRGSRVAFVVERPGVAQQIPVSLMRSEIHVAAARDAMLLQAGIGYVAVTTFSDSTAPELRQAVDGLRSRGMQTLVLDLRGNPGGLLEQGVAVADLFLPEGARIVSMRGRALGTNREFLASSPERWAELRIITLVDGGSASASEIVAGALQDHDRALVIGATSFGKGSAQSVYGVATGGALKMTTARWFTPLGRSISRLAVEESEESEDAASDTTAIRREPYRTPAGRTVFGGGAITPDLAIPAADTVPAEMAFARGLGAQAGAFRDALTDYAIALRAQRAVTSRDFVVTPAMTDELWRRMQARGIQVDRDLYDVAQPLVSRFLTFEIARYVFGPDAEANRRLRDDRVVSTALELARDAGTQAALFERAAARGQLGARE